MVYTKSGQYTQRLTNHLGCDSILTLKLTVGGVIATSDTITACDSYHWQGQTLTTSGDYVFRAISLSGCDSLVQLHLTIKNSVRSSVDTAICQGQSYLGYAVSNTYVDTFTLSSGCDSIRTLHLRVRPIAASSIKATICEGESYLGYSKSGTYQDRFSGINGCDSTRTLELTVLEKKFANVSVSICEGESYFAQGAFQTHTGAYKDTLPGSTGCDSIVTTQLLVHPPPRPSLGSDKNLCEGSSLVLEPGAFSSYRWSDGSTMPQLTVTATGSYWVKVWNQFKCSAMDTIQIIKRFPSPSHFLTPKDSICAGERLEIAPKEPFYRYLWSTGSSASKLLIDQPGVYALTVWDADECMGRDTTTIFQKQCYDGVAIPSAFTPNGDGLNDQFRARVPATLVSFRLEVYNRYGEIVFMTTDPKKGWDGLVNGSRVPATLFIWQCFYQLQGQPPGYQKGSVLLVR
jgi:gliding motility-associated-like protein